MKGSRRDVTAPGEQVEGRHAVRELLRAKRRRVRELTVAHGAEVEDLLDLARSLGVAIRWVDRHQLDNMARTEAPQGVVARADPLPEPSLESVLASPSPFLVVLDGVTDPHNLGAVMRSALSAGSTGLLVGRHRAAGLTPAAVKAAAGAAEHLPVLSVPGVASAISRLADAAVWTVGFDAGARSSLWDLDVDFNRVALVFGAEDRGLSRLVRERCDLLVSIPMIGPLGSLNVSAAATLGCFEVARRRGLARHDSTT